MKKTLALYLIIFLAGTAIGFLLAVIPDWRQTVLVNEREKQFRIRTEEYQPSCAELQNTKQPEITRRGADYFFVVTRAKDFMVFGVNVEEGNPPMIFWWGAERDSVLRQSCRPPEFVTEKFSDRD